MVDLASLMHCTILPLSPIRSFTVGHVEQMEQTQAEDLTNLVWNKASPDVFNPCSLSFILNLALCYNWLCIKLIGVVWNSSCNKINLLVYPC
jgi:hypothetical protein